MTSTLQAQRNAIDQQIAQEQHAEAMTAWEQAKKQAREGEAKVGELRRVFNKSAAQWAAYEKECDQVRQSLELHLAQRPAPDDFPLAEELTAWEEKRARLHKLLTVSMRARRLDLANVMEHDRQELLKADQIFISLAYAERVARTKALGEPAVGVSRVSL